MHNVRRMFEEGASSQEDAQRGRLMLRLVYFGRIAIIWTHRVSMR